MRCERFSFASLVFSSKYHHCGSLTTDSNQLAKLAGNYDVIVCGSDQIWAPNVYNPIYFASFAKESIRKISYAASIGLNDIPEETNLVQEVVQFIDSLKGELVPELNKINKANKATVGTFFSIRNPQNAMRSFGTFISKIDWSKSESLKELFLPFMYLGEQKPTLP